MLPTAVSVARTSSSSLLVTSSLLAPSSLLALLGLVALGCPATPVADQNEAAAKPERSTATETTHTNAPEFVLAPESGDVIDLVLRELDRARTDERLLLVYVGASWCEPCQYFHHAVEDGTLDDSLAGVRLLEFDLDRDRDRLVAAGYSSRMIPLFVVPAPDGLAGPRRTEGGVKGPAAVDNLRERLVPLLAAARADQG
jgi:thiol:disulfide interchange protein